MVVSVQLVPFWASFHWRKRPVPFFVCPVGGRSRPRWWSLSLCLSAEALVHVAEATSIVAEATNLNSIYSLAYLYWFSHVIYWFSQKNKDEFGFRDTSR
jgi:hypothetical protein